MLWNLEVPRFGTSRYPMLTAFYLLESSEAFLLGISQFLYILSPCASKELVSRHFGFCCEVGETLSRDTRAPETGAA